MSRATLFKIITKPKVGDGICEIVADPEYNAMGWGFEITDLRRLMSRYGFRTDTPRCALNRWLDEWKFTGEIVQFNAGMYFIGEVNDKIFHLVNAEAYNNECNGIYDDLSPHRYARSRHFAGGRGA